MKGRGCGGACVPPGHCTELALAHCRAGVGDVGGLGFRVWGLGFEVLGVEIWIEGFSQ